MSRSEPQWVAPTDKEKIEALRHHDGDSSIDNMICPKCGWFEGFVIVVETAASVDKNGAEVQFGDMSWNEHSYCQCDQCEHEATISEFTLEPDEIERLTALMNAPQENAQ